jgi:phosphonate transport system substrate-binding protein
MQRNPFLRMRFFASLLAATVFTIAILCGCSDSDRVKVDFSKKVDPSHSEKPQPEAALNVAIASMISPNETIEHYQALLEYLAAKVGRKINLVQRKTYVEINGLLGSGGIDLAFICSGPYASGRDRYHFEALAVPVIHQKSVYRAYLITSQDSPIMQLDDLRGKMFAFSDPDSNAGCIVPRFLLALKGERPESFFGKTIFTYSHDNSILAVSRSLVDGAFVHEHIWEYYSQKNPAIVSRARIVYASEPFGNPPLVASASMPEPLKKRIRELLFSMHNDYRGAEILRELLIDQFIPLDEPLYEPIRHMLAQSNHLEDGHAATSQP